MMLIWRNYSLITSLSKTYKGYRFCLSKLGLFFWISLFYSTFKIQCSTFSNFRWNIYRLYSPFWCFVIKINICFVNRIYLKIILLIKETSCFIVLLLLLLLSNIVSQKHPSIVALRNSCFSSFGKKAWEICVGGSFYWTFRL